jgi:threonine/homoserine/homoserine lactone efflux protein
VLPLSSLIAFTIAAGLMTLTPGLDTALVLRTAALEGPRRAMLAGLGIGLGCLVWGVAAAVGLGALLAVSHMAYDVLRLVGAGYLFYLGARMILSPRRSALPDDPGAERGKDSDLKCFLRGLFTNLLNPKVGVFYVSFLPQFIPAGMDVLVPSLVMTLIHDVEGILWFALLTMATRPLSRFLRRPTVVATLDRMTGGVLILFGAKLAMADHP